jgi:hypothetical protein
MNITTDRLKELIESAKEANAPRRKIKYLEDKLKEAQSNSRYFSPANVKLVKEDEKSITISTDGFTVEDKPRPAYYRLFKAILKS